MLSMSRGYKSRCRRRSGTPEQSPHINNDNMTEYLRYAFSARNKKPSTPPGRPQNSGDDPNDGDDGSPGDSPTGQAPRSLDMALKKLNENLICLECAKHIVEGVRCGHDQMTTRQKSCARCREKNCRCTLADGETLELIKNLVDWHTRFTKGDKKYTVEELQNYQVRLNYRINQDITRAASETRRRSPVKSGQSTNKSGQSNFLSKLPASVPRDAPVRGKHFATKPSAREPTPDEVEEDEEDEGDDDGGSEQGFGLDASPTPSDRRERSSRQKSFSPEFTRFSESSGGSKGSEAGSARGSKGKSKGKGKGKGPMYG